MTSVFYRTYRPQKFKEIVGQDLIKLTLSQAIKEGRVANAYLFSGPRGTGKTTTARILAKALNCVTEITQRENGDPCGECWSCKLLSEGNPLDLVEVDAASHTQVEKIRQLTENIDLSPVKLKYRIFIIDEVHMLSKPSFNALLKTLEEPPPHVIFIFATTEKNKVPATIISRCQHFSFKLLKNHEIKEKLKKIAQWEKIKIDDASLTLISEAALGGMRDAESLFYQIVSLAGNVVDFAEVQKILGLNEKNNEIELLKEIFSGEGEKVLDRIERIVAEGNDLYLLSHNLLNHLRKILILKVNPAMEKEIAKENGAEQANRFVDLGKRVGLSELVNLMAKIVEAQSSMKGTSLPRVPLEVACVKWMIDRGSLADNAGKLSAEEKESSEKKGEEKEKKKEEKASSSAVKMEEMSPLPKKKKKKETKKKKKEREKEKEKEEKKKEKKELLPSPAVDFGEVLRNWTKILVNVRDLQPALFSLLKVSSPVRIEGETLVVSTPYKFHKDKLNDLRNKKIFCGELKKVLGIKKVCVVQDSDIASFGKEKEDILDQVQSLLG